MHSIKNVEDFTFFLNNKTFKTKNQQHQNKIRHAINRRHVFRIGLQTNSVCLFILKSWLKNIASNSCKLTPKYSPAASSLPFFGGAKYYINVPWDGWPGWSLLYYAFVTQVIWRLKPICFTHGPSLCCSLGYS